MPLLKPSKSAILSQNFDRFGAEVIGVPLVNGIINRANRREYRVTLEPLTGRDEEGITRKGKDWNLPLWVSRLLGEKVICGGNPIGEDTASSLSVVDRDLLMLYMRILTFGPELWGTTICPVKECGAKLDFTFDLTSMSLPEPDETEINKSVFIDNKTDRLRFIYREPSGTDQIAIAGLAETDPFEAWLVLLSGCVVQFGGRKGPKVSPRDLEKLPALTLEKLDSHISESMKSLDWDVAFSCPHCKNDFVSTIDIQSYFWEELQYSSESFREDVHTLAFYYHWSESDILSLRRWKRRMYAEYIRRQIG